MKTMREVMKSDNFWRVNPLRTKAMPFPGRYPTRWRLMLFDNNHRLVHDYLGKPDRTRALQIMGKAKHFKGTIWVIEFDLGGAIRVCCKQCPRKNAAIDFYHTLIAPLYYGWTPIGGDFFDVWMQRNFHILELSFGPRKWKVYSLYDKFDTELLFQKLRDYRTWLRKVDPLRKLI